MLQSSSDTLRRTKEWFRRLGIAGFVFFLFKGLAWLIVPVILVESCG